MSLHSLLWALDQALPTPTSKLVLILLADDANHSGHGDIDRGELAVRAMIAPRSLRRALLELEQTGLIQRVGHHRFKIPQMATDGRTAATQGPPVAVKNGEPPSPPDGQKQPQSGHRRPQSSAASKKQNGHQRPEAPAKTAPPYRDSITTISKKELCTNSESDIESKNSDSVQGGCGGAVAVLDLDCLADLFGKPVDDTPRAKNGLSPQEMMAGWNALAHRLGLPKVAKLTKQRRAALMQCEEAWADVLAAIEASEFCQGGGPRGWLANFDFICQPSSRAKLVEGNFADSGRGRPKPGVPDTDRAIAMMMERRAADG